MKTKNAFFTLLFTCFAAATVGQTTPVEHPHGGITLYLNQNAGIMCGYGTGEGAGFHSDYSLSFLPELQMHQRKGMTLLKSGIIIDNNNFRPDVPDCTADILFAHIPLMAGYNFCFNDKLSVSLCGGLAYSWVVNYFLTDYPETKSTQNKDFTTKSSGLTTIHELNQRKG